MAMLDILPTEIITEIFSLCLPSEVFPLPNPTEAPLLLCQISSAWRAIALGCAPIWRTFSVSQGPRDPIKPWTPEEDTAQRQNLSEMMHLWDTNAKDTLRSVSLHVHPPIDVFNTPWQEMIESYLTQNAPRLQTLRLVLSSTVFPTSFFDLESTAVPELEILRYVSPHSVGEENMTKVSVFSRALSLRTVILERYYFDQYTMLPLPWAQLTDVTILGSQTLSLLHFILEHCKVLKYLSMAIGQPPPNHRDISPIRSLTANCLETLDVTFECTTTPSVFELISSPMLTKLRLCSDPNASKPVFNFKGFPSSHIHIFSKLQNLRSLTLGYHNICGDRLLEVLELTPLIVDLAVDTELCTHRSFFEALTYYRGGPRSVLVPRMENFHIYIQLFEVDKVDFTNKSFLDMIYSRTKGLDGWDEDQYPARLKTVYLYVQDNQDLRVNVTTLLAESSLIDFGDLDLQITRSDDLTRWLVETVIC